MILPLPDSSLLTANLVLCESVLTEANGSITAVRIINFFTIPNIGNQIVHFYSIAFLTCQALDTTVHTCRVQMIDLNQAVVAAAPPQQFQYRFDSNLANISGVGGFTLTTEFTVDSSRMTVPSPYLVTLTLDGIVVSQSLLMLRR